MSNQAEIPDAAKLGAMVLRSMIAHDVQAVPGEPYRLDNFDFTKIGEVLRAALLGLELPHKRPAAPYTEGPFVIPGDSSVADRVLSREASFYAVERGKGEK